MKAKAYSTLSIILVLFITLGMALGCNYGAGENCDNNPNNCPCDQPHAPNCNPSHADADERGCWGSGGTNTDCAQHITQATCEPVSECKWCEGDSSPYSCFPNDYTCQGSTGGHCGDGTCDANEDCYCSDCHCPGGDYCEGGQCVPGQTGGNCGDGTCDDNEDCYCSDCSCPSNQYCEGGQCKSDTTTTSQDSGYVCCQPTQGGDACRVNLGDICPNGFEHLDNEWVDPDNPANCKYPGPGAPYPPECPADGSATSTGDYIPPRPPSYDACGNCHWECKFEDKRSDYECDSQCGSQCDTGTTSGTGTDTYQPTSNDQCQNCIDKFERVS